jgi:Ca-activated chloride channel family protein
LLRARVGTGGLAAGGAKDIQLFRDNVARGYLPSETDITYEGLFYDYYFDTVGHEVPEAPVSDTPELFRPVYYWARLRDPLSERRETFLAVGLRSDLDTSTIARKRLNLAVVLDISGSMSAPFYSYYYDSIGERDRQAIAADPEQGAPKLGVATRAIVAMLDHLEPDDRFGMVLFNHGAHLAKPLRRVGNTDTDAIEQHILALEPDGGTNMEAGLRAGRRLLRGLETADPEQVENRIVFLTDAMPNQGATSEAGLAGLTRRYAEDRIYCTFLGVGVDFQTELVDRITKIRGANYHSIHSAWEFKKRLDREFDYMVTPWAFDLTLHIEADGLDIAAVYGSPEAHLATGELMRVATLFPAPVSSGAVKGGIILLALRPTGGPTSDLQLTARYEDRAGRRHRSSVTVAPPPTAGEACRSRDVRKAVLLARYARLMRQWIRAERGADAAPAVGGRSRWERTSDPLHVEPEQKERMRVFLEHFHAESMAIGDPDLEREERLLAGLAAGPQS